MSDGLAELAERLERHGQAHVLRGAAQLQPEARRRFAASLAALDLGLVQRLAMLARAGGTPAPAAASFAPARVFRPGRVQADRARAPELRRRGDELLRRGAVGYLLVAGGQAS